MRRVILCSVAGFLLAGSAIIWYPAAVAAERNDIRPGEFIVDPPTLINLGFEWMIDGDDNRNATVEVTYRKKGDRDWKAALPLLRLQNERINRDLYLDVIVPNMFAGSILDLEPDMDYECSFVLSDPDGARGQTRKTV